MYTFSPTDMDPAKYGGGRFETPKNVVSQGLLYVVEGYIPQ